MHVNEEMLHEENGGTTPETLHWYCIMRKVISKKDTSGGRFDLFLDSEYNNYYAAPLSFCFVIKHDINKDLKESFGFQT